MLLFALVLTQRRCRVLAVPSPCVSQKKLLDTYGDNLMFEGKLDHKKDKSMANFNEFLANYTLGDAPLIAKCVVDSR